MAKREPIDFSNPIEELFGGGGYFADGIYDINRARYTFFDFGRADNDSLCMYMELQPVIDGNPEGDVVERYWPLGDKMKDGTVTVEPCTPVNKEKGFFSQVRLTEANTHDKLFAFSDFGYFMTAARKAEVDMDAIGNDITNFDGQRWEFGKMVKTGKKKTAVELAEGGDDEKKDSQPKEVIIIVGPGETKAKGKSKPAAGKDKEKPTGKPAGKGKSKAEPTPEEIVNDYLNDNVCTEDNEEDGAQFLSHRLALSKYLAKDLELEKEQVKECMAVYNDRDALEPILTALGWELSKDGKTISKSEG